MRGVDWGRDRCHGSQYLRRTWAPRGTSDTELYNFVPHDVQCPACTSSPLLASRSGEGVTVVK